MTISRRDFLATGALASTSMLLEAQSSEPAKRVDEKRPVFQPSGKNVIISKHTGSQAIDGAWEMLRRGGDTLDAALFVCRAQEDDPSDDTVGYGGLANEDGEVELDACCMHGPTRRAGAVAAIRGIKNPCMVAKLVMERTDHLLLVAEGAQKFALRHGFKKEDLLTERSRKIWLLWKEAMSDRDSWGPGLSDPNWKIPDVAPVTPKTSSRRIEELRKLAEKIGIEPELREYAIGRVLYPPTGTIHVSTLNAKGEMSGATTTSGLAFKLAGRVGDSPIIGAGCWTDQNIGSAGATGRGEENIKVAGAHTIVENMRRGMSPADAGLDTLRRIAANFNDDEKKLRFMNMVYYILRRDGAYAGVSLWSHGGSGKRIQYAVHDGEKRLENTIALFEGSSINWPPIPSL